METRKFWTYENKLVSVLFFVWGFVMFDRLALNFMLPFIATDLQLTNTHIGMIISAFSLTWALSGYFGGFVSDITGSKKKILLIAVLLFSLFSFLSGIATGFIMLLLFRMLMGLFEGPVLPIAQSMMAVESSESRRGFNMGLLQSSAPALLASVLGPLVIVALANAYGWRSTFFLTVIPGIILFMWIRKSVREPKQLTNQTAATGTSKEKVRIGDIFKNRNVWISIIISSFFIAWYIEILTFSPLYLVNVQNMPPSTMSYIMSALGLGGVLWGFAVPALSDRFGRKPVMIIFSFISAVAPLGILYIKDSLWLLALAAFVGNVGVGCFVLYMSTIPSESVAPKYVATAIGLIMAIGELIGGVAGSTLAGMSADRFGLSAPIFIALGCAIIAGLLSFFYYETAPIKVRHKSPVEPSINAG